MNNKHILDLTVRLSQALDQNYDVVNMEAVLSVISALEGAKITKEQLETTRLAKFINQLRRRTKSEQLARRAKSLLKKWREMVGIQQTNETATSSTPTINVQLHNHRSQPTSPIVGGSMGLGGNVAVKSSSDDFLRSTVSNPSTNSSATGSASINLINNKRLRVVGAANLSAVPIPTVPANEGRISIVQPVSTTAVGKQPTSFANLLTGINSTGSGSGGINIGLDILSSPSSRKSNKRKDRSSAQSIAVTNTFVIDQSSSSNTEFSRLSSMKHMLPNANSAPIVIDIQDSNSGSNIIASTSTPTITTPSVSISSVITSGNPKIKKSKKEKKRKERDHQHKGVPTSTSSTHFNVSHVIDDSCSNQLRPVVDQDFDKYVSIIDDRSRITCPTSGISEILSLSNSSMSSIFPNSAAAGALTAGHAACDQNRTDASVGSNSSRTQAKPLSTSDLTFAGKFKQLSSSGSSDLFGFNGSGVTTNRTDVSNTVTMPASTSSLTKVPFSRIFLPFSGSGCNSNDSTSNSRTSQLDIIDVVNQDNSQSKIIDELRQQHKIQANKDFTSSPISAQQQPQMQQKPMVSTNSTGQRLLPPISSTANTRTNNTGIDPPVDFCEVEQKIPKKRGRKKGSKGVDSLLAKETSLSSQMLMSSLGGKKVKTTKELYTEMQNRKLGLSSTTSSPTLTNWLAHQQLSHISRPNSSCSEPSLHSPRTSDACSTNATISTVATRSTPDKNIGNSSIHGDEIDESDSDSNTSDPSRDSATAARLLRRRPSTDSNSNSQLITKTSTYNSSAFQTQSFSADSIQKQIKELLSHMPPVPLIDKIEWECFEDIVPCTCKIIEIESCRDELQEDIQKSSSDKSTILLSVNDCKKIEADEDQVSLISISLPTQFISHEKVAKLVEIKPDSVSKPTSPQKPKKSIFDLDFDDEEDPLHKYVAEAAAENEKRTEKSTVKMELIVKTEETSQLDKVDMSILPAKVDQHLISLVDQTIVQELPSPFPTYVIEEDPKCLAKERYEIQTQKIAKFHITALHNCYIPNVNGNWDNAETNPISSTVFKETTVYKEMEKPADTLISSADLWRNVVPKYSSLITEHIPKDLSHIQFTLNFKPKKRSSIEKRQYLVPFLGVARKRLRQDKLKQNSKLKKFPNQLDKNCHKIKEEADNKEGKSEEICADVQRVQEIKAETNNNDESKYVQNDDSSLVFGNIAPKIKQEKTQIKQECTASDNSNNLISNYNLSSLSVSNTTEIRNQPIVFSDIQGSNNIMFGGITIDIGDEVGSDAVGNVPINDYNDVASRSLLTIIDKLPGNLTESKENLQQKLCENVIYQSFENQNDQNINNNNSFVSETANVVDFVEDKSVPITVSSALEKHANSRRSSSCSNSSLKQTQHSINLKLRRRRLQQQQEKIKSSSSHGSCEKKRRRQGSTFGGETSANKPRSIKRIKIAINGDVATQRQISVGSSNNSTDEDDEYNDNECYNSGGSRSSPIEHDVDDYNVVDEDYEEEEEYIDDDDDEDDEEDENYEGDYHEVVTRDISATSTGNNHIVLTIKKTPSKMNSPSDSLSAMSPVITQVSTAKPAKSTVEISANNEEETIEVEVKPSITHSAAKYLSDSTECTENMVKVANNQEVLNIETSNTDMSTSCATTIGHRLTNQLQDNIKDNLKITALPGLRQQRHRQRKKKRRMNLVTRSDVKLHHKLFFPHELKAKSFGVKERLLNISSCSSSCAEDSEYEQYEETTDEESNLKDQRSVVEKQEFSHTIMSLRETPSNCSTYTESSSSASDSDDFSDSSSNSLEDGFSDNLLSTEDKFENKDTKKDLENNITEGAMQIQTPPRDKNKKYRRNKPKSDIAGVRTVAELIATDIAKEETQEGDILGENNGLLKTFNNIYLTPEQVKQNESMTNRLNIAGDDVSYVENAVNEVEDVVVIDDIEQQRQQPQPPNENCDVYSNFYNNNNNSKLDNSYNNSLKTMVRSSSSNNSCSNNENVAAATASGNISNNNDNADINNHASAVIDQTTMRQLIPHKEYRTGLRAVDEDVDDEDGNNCARIQQFKEWHQVLQLRSYNDELLTVLPYVVLE